MSHEIAGRLARIEKTLEFTLEVVIRLQSRLESYTLIPLGVATSSQSQTGGGNSKQPTEVEQDA